MTEQVFIRAEIIGTNPAGQKHIHLLATGADGIHFWTDDKNIVRTARPDEPKQVIVIQLPRGMLFSSEDYLTFRKNILSQMQEGLVIISAETNPFVINKDSSVEIREETTT